MTAKPAARCLDLTRLVSRIGRGPFTGIDRVELAYLRHLTELSAPLFSLVRVRKTQHLLAPDATKAIYQKIEGYTEWGKASLAERAHVKLPVLQQRARSDVGRAALANASTRKVSDIVAKHLPAGTDYLNVGHTNLSAEVLGAFSAKSGHSASVMIHDTIPLDYPQYQTTASVDTFARRLKCAGQHADRLIYISAETRRTATQHLDQWHLSPDSVVAHLGVTRSTPNSGELPQQFDPSTPYFVILGTIEPRKNHQLLLDVWARLADAPQPPRLIIAGQRGWLNQDVFARLDRHPENVEEYHSLSDGAVAALLQGAIGLLFPSFAEGFGLPPAEAAALGVPVVCSNLPAVNEILADYPVYLNPTDMYSWETTILKLTDNAKNVDSSVRQSPAQIALPTWAEHFKLVLNTN